MGFVASGCELYDQGRDHGRIPVVQFTTAGMVPSDRFSAWRHLIGVLFDAVPMTERSVADFSAAMTAYHFGAFILCHSRAGGVRYLRSAERIQWCDLDHCLIHVPLNRPVGFVGARLRPMDVGVLGLSQSAGFVAAAGEAITVLLPRGAIKNPGHQHGRVLLRETPMGAVLAQHLVALTVEAPRLGMAEASAFSGATMGLITTCLGLGAEGKATTADPGPHDLVHRVRAHLEQNLHREELTPETIVKDLCISRSQLYRQFERFGGVQHYIRQRRLRRCLLAICNPIHAGQRIADIAYDHGFMDEAHFSRLFRQAFGLSPRAARLAVQSGDASVLAALVPASPDQSPFAHWLRELTAA